MAVVALDNTDFHNFVAYFATFQRSQLWEPTLLSEWLMKIC